MFLCRRVSLEDSSMSSFNQFPADNIDKIYVIFDRYFAYILSIRTFVCVAYAKNLDIQKLFN